MVFGPWVETGHWIKSRIPSRFKLPDLHFNFITIHYLYITGWALVGSWLIYPAGGVSYVDAVLFGSGAATQSGLNPVDINTLYLYQQVVIMMIACVCNPIFIHSFVVFVRLYWFEKRFQTVVKDARNFRRTRSRARTFSKEKENRDIGSEEQGVEGRQITVVREANGHAQGHRIDDERSRSPLPPIDTTDHEQTGVAPNEKAPRRDSDNRPMSPNESLRQEFPNFRRDIMFADEVNTPRTPRSNPQTPGVDYGPRPPSSNLDRIPEQRAPQQHIEFVQNQRRKKEKGTLRIPGPRDFDKGEKPQEVDEGDAGEDLSPEVSRDHGEIEERDQTDKLRNHPSELNNDDHPFKKHISFDQTEDTRGAKSEGEPFKKRSTTTQSDATLTANPLLRLRNRIRSKSVASFDKRSEKEEDPMPYLSWTATVGRNSNFVELTEEQREELGGIEYRALKLLAFILVSYFVGFQLFAMLSYLPWIVRDGYYSSILVGDGINPVWWGFFTPASMFNDLGFTLTPDSMISFQAAVWPMLVGSFLILIGNTGFPCMLRFVIWVTQQYVPRGSAVWEELRFLLDHPRRCFTLLFPSNANWWLFWVLVLLNIIDLIFFIILDLNDDTVTALPPGIRVLDGWFQATSTRTAGFSCVNLADLHPAIQVSYLIMMYIAVYPVAISLRRTNVYEEKSLGMYSDEGPADDTDPDTSKMQSFVGTHIRRQLSFDLWYVFLGFFFIAIIEGDRLQNTNDYAFTLFSVLFEIVSAYGTVGLSLGYPGVNTSFCGQFRVLSKLIIAAMQIRGRHRGLPYAVDRAILLPSESLQNKERKDDEARMMRRNSTLSQMDGPGGPMASAMSLPRVPTSGRRNSTGSYVGGQTQAGRGGIKLPNLGKVLSGALSAGPTLPRKDD